MKKYLVLLLTIICFAILDLQAQTSFSPSKTDVDLSSFEHVCSGQTWKLTRVAHNQLFTGLFIRIYITNNKASAFHFRKDIYISGDFGALSPIGLTIRDKDYEFNEPFYYNSFHKNEYIDAVLHFPRIPAGIKSINYCEPGFINWENIPVVDNQDTAEKSDWTETAFRSYWDTNKCSKIEGIYYFTSTNKKEWWGEYKHTLAVIKDGYQYKLIYLRGSNPNVWYEGDVKAVFIPTATRGLYKATLWLMENKMNNEDFYLKFNDGFMSIYENTSNVTAEFLKLYPATDANIEDDTYINKSTARPSVNSKNSGSGIFISDKLVATNFHVISDASKIEIVVKDGNNISTYNAKVLSTDKTNDLALLNIDDSKFNGIGELPFAISTKTRDVGTAVFTMGYPMTDYMGEEVKITDGIINSKTGYNGDIVTYQISAPIQPGSSGGPLFDKFGNLIGITNAGIMNAQNVGYAIKGSYLCNLIESAPISISIPENNTIGNLDLTEQIKCLSKFVTYIKVYR